MLLFCLLLPSVLFSAGITWPADQFLPSFSTPAETLDLMARNNTDEEWVMFVTLKGLVNKTQPRIYSYTGGEEGQYTWLNDLGLKYATVADNWSLITKYRSAIKGIVAYNSAALDARNLATTVAALLDGIAVSSALVGKMTSAPYDLPIIADLRGLATDNLGIYQYLHDNYWPQLNHRLLVCLNPGVHIGCIRDYASATSAAIVWLDPRVAGEKVLLDSFLADMPGGHGVTLGWWPEEGSGITEASQYGLATCASDFSENLTVFSGMSRTVTIKPIPPKPTLKNKIYVAMILSDGDNLQYLEHHMKTWWDQSIRGSFPLSWTVSPATLDAMPAVLNYYYRTATANDCFISGPSGIAYTYPNYWRDTVYLATFVKTTDNYMKRAGFHVVTIWNTILGGISDTTGNIFADNSTTILGITGMKAGGQITVYRNKLPGQALNATYCYSQASTIMEITNACANWNGSAPRFVSIQANPWQPTFQELVNAVASFKSDTNMVFVRADTYFQLLREARGLPWDLNLTAIFSPKSTTSGQSQLRFDQSSATITISGVVSPERALLELYDVRGKNILTCRGKRSVSLKSVPTGSYIAVLRTGRATTTLRCVDVR